MGSASDGFLRALRAKPVVRVDEILAAGAIAISTGAEALRDF